MSKSNVAFLLILVGLFLLVGAVLVSGPDVPEFVQVRDEYRQSDRFLLDYEGRILHEMRVDPKIRRLQWTKLEDISPSLIDSLVMAEDKRFWSHNGVDLIAMFSGLKEFVTSKRLRGASTITMQLVSLLSPEIKPIRGRRTLGQKLRQMKMAWRMENKWSKVQVLEAYLNLVSYRGELQGVAAAARGLFQKSPHGLTNLESTLLVSLIRSPNASPEEVYKRAQELSQKLEYLENSESIEKLVLKVLSRPYFVEPQKQNAPHIARRLLAASTETNSVRSTLDRDIQEFARMIVRQRLIDVSTRNVRDGALLVVDNKSGAVRAYVANGGEYSSARHVDGIRSLRQAGSTLKPFLYAEAFARKILTPASLLDDSVLNVPVVGGIYRPSNYDHLYRGPVSTRIALASSLNIPAVRTLELLGEEVFVARLRSLGFEGLQEAEFYGPSIALGSADVTLWNLVNAYRTLANQGEWSPLRLVVDLIQSEKRRIFPDSVCFLISSILSDRESRSTTFSLESPLSTRFWTAVKTGTSKDMRDNWCLGYSSEFTVGAWVGNFSGDPMWNVSGITGAAPLWVEMMNFLHKNLPSTQPEKPERVRKQTIQFSGSLSTREEWFLEGTEVESVDLGSPESAPSRIVYPASGTVIALDPDIPVGQQRMYFEASPASGSFSWQLNGEKTGTASTFFVWTPVEGKHVLSLNESSGRIIDQVTFFVRGFRKMTELENLIPGQGIQVLEPEGEQ